METANTLEEIVRGQFQREEETDLYDLGTTSPI